MPLVLVTVGAAVVVAYLRGGRLARMAEAGLRHSWLLFLGLALQLAVDALTVRDLLGQPAGYLLLLASQLLVVAWVAVNWWRPGMLLVALGLLMNAVVIGANGAMPVSQAAIDALGLGPVEVHPGKHELMTDRTRLAWLADIYALPPMRTIISLGDIVLAAGLIPLVHHLMTYRPPAERRGGLRSGRGEREAQTVG